MAPTMQPYLYEELRDRLKKAEAARDAAAAEIEQITALFRAAEMRHKDAIRPPEPIAPPAWNRSPSHARIDD